MNPLLPRIITGTVGELLVQLRLFQFDVQAAPPLKDSGNDLIGIRGNSFKAIQVKTTGNLDGRWNLPVDRQYHLLALVRLHGEVIELRLDESEIYLISREEIDAGNIDFNNLSDHAISPGVVDRYFPPPEVAI
jgi:hypothetical protein